MDAALTARPDETILRRRPPRRAIPRLCYTEGMRPDGNCRACVVEIDGERVLAPLMPPHAKSRDEG